MASLRTIAKPAAPHETIDQARTEKSSAECGEQRLGGLLPKPQEEQSRDQKAHAVHAVQELYHRRPSDELTNEAGQERGDGRRDGKAGAEPKGRCRGGR